MNTTVKFSTKITTTHIVEENNEPDSILAEIGNLKLRLHKMRYTLDELNIISKNCSLHLNYIDKINSKPIEKVKTKVIPTLCGSAYKAVVHLR